MLSQDQKQTLLRIYSSFRRENETDAEGSGPSGSTDGVDATSSAGAVDGVGGVPGVNQESV